MRIAPVSVGIVERSVLMSGILAIEPSPQRRGPLAALVREHANTELTIVPSVQAAIAVFERRQPDVIVAPALLSPEESDRLCAYVREHAAPHVQMFTASALDLLRTRSDTTVRGSWLTRRRGAGERPLQYDPASLGRHIAERLEHARQLREQQPSPSPVTSTPEGQERISPTAAATADAQPRPRQANERRRAERLEPRAPGLWSVQLPWYAPTEVANISRSGILLQSTSKVSSGMTLDLRLSGKGADRIVAATFVRSEVAQVDSRGVRYHLAARFQQPLDILSDRSPNAPEPTPRALADLFVKALSEPHRLEDRSMRFARGLRALVGARNVLIRRAPAAPSDDSESIYFTVSADEARPMVLQVFFDPDRPPTPIEFALLKAAAPTTAAILELGRIGVCDVMASGVA